MNYFSLAGVMVATKPTQNYIRAVALGQIFGHNIDFFADTGQGMKWRLPFALTNITDTTLTNTLYDSSAQGVNEFSDRPFAMKGLIVVLSTLTTDTDWKKDLDNYRSWEVSADSGGTPVLYTIAIGVLNSTLTESYTPLSTVDKAVYYDDPMLSQNINIVQYTRPAVQGSVSDVGFKPGGTDHIEFSGASQLSSSKFGPSTLQRFLTLNN